MYFFYLVESALGKPGFGITQDPKERSKQYSSHSGAVVTFPTLYGGHRPHAKALERIIKTQYVDKLWKVGEWTTEWVNCPMSELREVVDELIAERHLKLELVASDFDFTQDLTLGT